MEDGPVELAGAALNSSDSVCGPELQPNSDDLQPTGAIEAADEGSTGERHDQAGCRSADQLAGPQQVVAAHRDNVSSGAAPGSAANLVAAASLNPDQAPPANMPTGKPERKLTARAVARMPVHETRNRHAQRAAFDSDRPRAAM